MLKSIRRLAVVLAGMTGLLALVVGVAHAKLAANHCEPLRRG